MADSARTNRRLARLRGFLAHAHERLELGFGFVLPDASTVPADLPAGTLAVAIADEGAVASLIRRPKLDTILNLWSARRLDIRSGTIFDLVALRPKTRTRNLLGKLDKRRAFATALAFLTLPRGGPWPLEAQRRSAEGGQIAEQKANVAFHYDVSNAFYALFLDPELVYSCAYFTDWGNDIAQAQRDKLDMICRKLRLKPGEHLLDVGCGWGALICHAAANYGVSARGITLSQEQFAHAKAKVARLGLESRVTVELKDYSRLDGSFDKIASIGMFEHVGIDNHPAYFSTISRLLKRGGLYLHHAIARPAKRNDRVFRKGSPEYAAILRYIFPGAELDHVGMSAANLERFGFEVHDVEGWREHYARTCRLWHDRLLASCEAAEREVGSAKTRLWLAYLAGCSLGFERGTLGIFQTLASKRERGASGLPPTRADLYR